MIDRFDRRARMGATLVKLACVLAVVQLELRAAETPSLARLVPATAGLCVEIQDLAGALAKFQNGELAKRAGENPAIRAKLAAPLIAIRSALVAQLRVSTEESAVLFGDRLLVAVWPEKSPGEDSPALVIVRCPDKALLESVAGHIVARQRKAGRLAPTRRLEVQGRSVEVHAIKADPAGNRAQVCLAIVGNLALVSNSEKLLEEIAAAELEPTSTEERASTEKRSAPSLADLPVYRAAIERLNPSAAVRLFLNPRQWDDQMHAKARPKSGRKALVHDAISGVWEASDYVSASLEAADSLKLEVFLACQHSRLLPPLKSVLASVAGPSRLVERLPVECLAVVMGRIDVGQIYHALLDAPSVENYALLLPDSLPWSAAMALAGSLGPDLGLAVLAPRAAPAGGEPPVDWLLGIETHAMQRGAGDPPSVSWLLPWLRETVRVSASSAKASGKQPDYKATTIEQQGVQLTGISGNLRLPACRTLFLAEQDRRLWLGNSARLTAQAVAGRPGSQTSNRRYQALHNPRLGSPSDLLLLDLAGIRRVLVTWPVEPSGQLADLVPLAKLADSLLVEIQCDSAFTAFSLHIGCD